jgi:hypothetical protein
LDVSFESSFHSFFLRLVISKTAGFID